MLSEGTATAMSEPSTSRAGSEQPRRVIRPSASRTTSSSKLSQRAQKAAAAQQEQACCSEGAEGVLICCDSPDCVAEDIPICPSDAGDVPDDCFECQQAAETGCSGECIVEAVATDADGCPVCVGDIALDAGDCQESSELPGALSAADAFNAEEPIQACDVPGCSALEWDEKAVDELLRCCCNGSDHHHESFAIPSHVPDSNHAHHDHQHQHSHQHQHQHVPLVANTVSHASENAALPARQNPGSHAFHAYHYHPHSHGHDSSQAADLIDLHPACTANASNLSNSADFAPSQSQSPFQHTGQSFHANHLSQASNFITAHSERSNDFTSSLMPVHLGHSRSQSSPNAVATRLPLPTMDTPASARPTFHCEWSDCSASFPTREELVGHVTVSHLLQVKASTTKPACVPPTPAHSHVSSVNRLSETRDGSNGVEQASQSLPVMQSNMFPILGQYQMESTGSGRNTSIIFGDLHNQPTDPSFDHTLRCLWDSCEASLPVPGGSIGELSHTAPSAQPIPAHHHHHLTNAGVGSTGMSHSHGSFQGLPDQSTASLVRHLLQDHLHLPTDVLGQLSPALPVAQYTSHHGTSTSISDVASQHGSSFANSAPVSAYSTPHNMPIGPAIHSPAVYKPPPTPPLASAEHHFKFDFGLSSAPAFASWPPQSTAHQQPLQAAPRVDSETMIEASVGHSCKWKGCRLSFEKTAELMDHISIEHIGSGKSMYYCEWDGCDRAHEGRGFNQRQKVMRHVRTHVGDKPFICSECGRAFSESTTMAQHMRTHTNEKPFECPEPGCGKTFALQSALTIHMRVHTGEKPFKCPHPGCGMAFAESSNLSKHVKTHLARGPLPSLDNTASSHRGRKRRYTSATEIDDAPYSDVSSKLLKA